MDDIQLRIGNENDIPKMVSLLKLSLGESKLPKNEKTIRYKHFQNPFGKSLIILAFKEDLLVGLRCYMQWVWALGDSEYKTFRAVDTAVHPSYQQKGIFTKMNMFGIKAIREKEGDFIFNTPNSNSLPGNLKMGWKKVNRKIKVNLKVNFLWFFSKNENISNDISSITESTFSKDFLLNYNFKLKKSESLFTPKDRDYLNWRYVKNPLRDYSILSGDNFFLVGYIRKHKWFNEFRIVEKIFSCKEDHILLKKHLTQYIRDKGIGIITEATNTYNHQQVLSGHFGPILVYKKLSENSPGDFFLEDLTSWNYSLGDLELF